MTTTTTPIILGTAIGLIAANYMWQAFTGGNWILAAERSWFQATALLAVWLGDLWRG